MSVRGDDEKFRAAKARSKVGREYISREPLSRYSTVQWVSVSEWVGTRGGASLVSMEILGLKTRVGSVTIYTIHLNDTVIFIS